MHPDPLIPPLSAEEIRAILDRCEAATPGPWRAAQDELGHWRILWRHSSSSSVARKVYAEEDAAFIAHARADVPRLAREVLRLRALCASLEPPA